MAKKSKRKINERMKNKKNVYLAEAIYLAKKMGLIELATAISVPTRMHADINVGDIEDSKSDVIIVPGKVLASGNIKRKAKIYAFGFSQQAMEKLQKAGCECRIILDALKKNEKIKGEILKK